MTDKVSPRHRARELVLMALYASEHGEGAAAVDISEYEGDEPLPEKARKFAEQLLLLVREHSEWADQRIIGLAHNWDLDRMAAIDRTILRMAMVELEYLVDVPVKVVLNEAIELAKQYSTEESSSFVNGVLDSFAKGKAAE